MANTLTPVDVYALFNEIVSQATGRTDLKAVDSTSFQTVGEIVLRTGTENILNSVSTVLSRTIFSVRPYRAKLSSLAVSESRWGGQVRKIVTMYDEAEKTEDWNTDSNPAQLNDGEAVDMYKIRKPKVLQLNFYGTKLLQKHITRFRDQLSLAFSDEREFLAFIDSVMIEFFNDIELLNETKSRLALISHIAGMVNMGVGVVDLVSEYNTKYGTTYTRAELLSSQLPAFMKFAASTIKIYSMRLTDMTTKYHANLDGYPKIMRHTPKERQKMIMYNPVYVEAESEVYSSLFNPQYLEIGDFEGVNYWQSQDEPTQIKVKPNILDTATGASKDGVETTIPYCLGILFDEEALGVLPQFDYASSTPFNSAGGYWNMYMHWRFNVYSDYTENAVVFVLGDGGAQKVGGK